MFLNDEKVIELLKESNLYRISNYYFLGSKMPTIGQYALLGVFANFIDDVSGYIVNYNEYGLGFIPINSMSGKPMIDNVFFIANEDIQKVEIKGGGLFFYKTITIVNKENQAICFKVTRKVLKVKKHRENVDKFISDFSR